MFTVGDIVTYTDYGTFRRAQVARIGKSGIVYIRRLDGPLAGGTAWMHSASLIREAA